MSALKLVRERKVTETEFDSHDLRGLGTSAALAIRSHEPALFVDFVEENVANSISRDLGLKFTIVIDNLSRKVTTFYCENDNSNPVISLVRLVACAELLAQKDSSVSCEIANLPLLKLTIKNDGQVPHIKDAATDSLNGIHFEHLGLKIEQTLFSLLESNTKNLGWGQAILTAQMSPQQLHVLFQTKNSKGQLQIVR